MAWGREPGDGGTSTRAPTGSVSSGVRPRAQGLAHGDHEDTTAVVFTIHLVPTLASFEYPACGAGRVTYQLRKTGGETEAQGGGGTHSEPQRGVLAPDLARMEKVEEDGGEGRRPEADVLGTCDKAQAWLT